MLRTSLKMVIFVVMAGFASAAYADAPQHLVDSQGFTVYTYDPDQPGVSNCYNGCAKAWPPVAPTEANPPAPYTVIERKDGTQQLAYDNHPLYNYVGDSQPGDTNGDGLGGVWHIVPESN